MALYKTKLRAVGKSTGLILPKELLAQMNLKQGDVLCVQETRAGYILTPYDEDLEKDMEIADAFMAKYRNTMKKLAE